MLQLTANAPMPPLALLLESPIRPITLAGLLEGGRDAPEVCCLRHGSLDRASRGRGLRDLLPPSVGHGGEPASALYISVS